MWIERLALENFRLFARADLCLRPGVNLFTGRNAQGKTTVLEAAAYLSAGRSFRTAKDREAIRHGVRVGSPGGKISAVEARFHRSGASHTVRMAITEHGKSIFVNGKSVRKLGELWGLLNTVIFIPGDLRLAQGGPAERRSLMDTLLARTSAADLRTMQDYSLAVRERNALLRDGVPADSSQYEAYEDQMALHGARLALARGRLIAILAPEAQRCLEALSGGGDSLQVDHESGFSKASGIPEQIAGAAEDAAPAAEAMRRYWAEHRRGDWERGYTHAGPHRADIALILNGKDARAYASQGQCRSLVLALRLAELALLRKLTGEPPVLLMDDVMGELDKFRSRQFIRMLSEESMQTLLTATDAAQAEAELPIAARFQVEDGTIHEAAH